MASSGRLFTFFYWGGIYWAKIGVGGRPKSPGSFLSVEPQQVLGPASFPGQRATKAISPQLPRHGSSVSSSRYTKAVWLPARNAAHSSEW